VSRTAALPAVLLAFAALLIFPSLDNRYLWDDEAETALLAKNVLRFGAPVAWDGRDLVSQECGADYDADYLWRQTPWLPIYATALSFKLLGPSTLAARLPFAVLGALCVLSLYVVGASLFGERATAGLAAASLLLSVPFLLHVRQGRYYSLAIFAAIWTLYFFVGTLRDRRFAVLGLALALGLVFHANYLLFFATLAGFAAASFAVARDRHAALRLAVAGLGALVLILPWAPAFDLGGRSGATLAALSPAGFFANLWGYAWRIELYALPTVLLAAVLAARARLARGRPAAWPHTRLALALVLLVVGHLVFVALTPFVFFRYAITLLPALALLQAWTIRAVWPVSRPLALAALALALVVDRADLLHATAGSPLLKYAGEVTHDVGGPIKAIVAHLEAEARPGERVFITYGDLPLRFYTALEIRGGQGCQSLADWPLPDWVVVRYFFRFRSSGPGAREDAERTLRFLRAEIRPGRYRRVDLPVADTIWENIPEPDRHVFRAPTNRPPVTLYRKVDAR
jgi:4-amino-4-deoxy-L-arabinose transferase-like glycosyltransferase